MTFLQKRPVFFTNTQKHYFSGPFFEIFFFQCFHVFSFSFSNIKETKTKSAHFFSKTLFLTPWQTAKKLFSHPYTLFVFFKIPKKHYKTGENKQKKILDQVLTQPWTKFWLKKPQILDQVLTLQHIYICMLERQHLVQDLGGGLSQHLVQNLGGPSFIPVSTVWDNF